MHREERILRRNSTNSYKTEEHRVKAACDGLTAARSWWVASVGRRNEPCTEGSSGSGHREGARGRFVISNF